MKKVVIKKLKKTPISHNKKIMERVVAKKGQISNISQIAQMTLKSGNIYPAHVHEKMYEVYYVEKGRGIVKIDGKVEKISAGEVLVVEPGESHEFLNNSRKDMTMFYFAVNS